MTQPFRKFRTWVELEEQKDRIIRAVKEGADFSKHLTSFLSTALPFGGIFGFFYWMIPMRMFFIIVNLSRVKSDVPLIARMSPRNIKKEDWDYDGRAWHLYSHILADAYGWSLEYIANLLPEEALAKVQEILVDEQLRKEFEWSTTEVAYKYDKGSKKSYLQRLDRPYYMHPKMVAPKKSKMPRYLIPIGAVDYKAVGNLRPKEIEKTSAPETLNS